MLRMLKQVRSAFSLLNPDEVRKLADRELYIGLVASNDRSYAEMEDVLVPSVLSGQAPSEGLRTVYRAGEAGAPDHVDLILYEQGLPCPRGTFTYYRQNPELTVAEILRAQPELALPLARRYPVFRRPVVERIIHMVSRENALFAVATALPNVVPNLIELPWAISEFASDTIFLTANQVRMAFLVAAASGDEVGFAHQKAEVASIAAGAFGWRALARELAGKIPLGGGLIPKGAIAYAATFVIGKGLEHYHHAGVPYTRTQREEAYQHAFERGKEVAQSLSKLSGPTS